MLTRQFLLPLHHELVIDLFAGGGGASTGIEQAIGRPVDIAVNHDPAAISLHEANHPQTRHYVSDVFEVAPHAVTQGRPVGLLWASPDCTFHSKARGGKPFRDRKQANRRRSLAWVVVRWAKEARPRVISLENVEEFQHWGPLRDDGTPCPDRRGDTFERWVAQLRNLGYAVEWRELRACDYGAPTIRKRLFLIARCDGQPIVWPAATHGAPDSLPVRQKKLLPWRTAAECIDWSVAAPSIFNRKRPLADATCRRIAKGIVRYVIEAAEPFIVPITHTASGERVHPIDELMRTVTTAKGGELALVAPTLVETSYGERPGQAPRAPGLDKPLGTVVGTTKHALVAAFLAKHYGGVVGTRVDQPTGTVTTVDHHSVVAANRVHMGHGEGKDGSKRFSHGVRDVQAPLNTVTASGATAGLVHAFLVKYYGTDGDVAMADPLHTVTTRDRFGLVLVKGEAYAIVDIGLRMLTPRELYRAQGFPDSYVIDRTAGGPLTKTAQVRMCGNSVCPPIARALVAANFGESAVARKVA